MAVSIDGGVLFVGALVIKALLLGAYRSARDFWKLPYECILWVVANM